MPLSHPSPAATIAMHHHHSMHSPKHFHHTPSIAGKGSTARKQYVPLPQPVATCSAFIPHPPSPPVRRRSDSLSSDASVSSASSTATTASKKSSFNDISGSSKQPKKVRFVEMVAVRETFSSSEYDRTTIDVSPLTRNDIAEILQIRAQMHQHTLELYRQRHLAEDAQIRASRNADTPTNVVAGFYITPVSFNHPQAASAITSSPVSSAPDSHLSRTPSYVSRDAGPWRPDLIAPQLDRSLVYQPCF
ncbi:hypothetical protein SpCBS45565_g04187 [Spizellomyces sp. 'palustris']|nr:hypothetical protein SpCBS45565_g04187 [Spizellomyces sp. 'palustris']